MYSEKIYTYIKGHNLIQEKDKIVVAVSGGPDSMCLLHYLINYKKNTKIEIIAAHVNHHTRGIENVVEQKLIEKFCEENNIDIYVEDFIYKSNKNFHDEARKFRYDFFVSLCKKLNCNKIALAHHQDDQIETILFKILRGNNLNGYTGMKEIYDLDSNINIIRPFLNITKEEIVNYCDEFNIPYKIDSSNLKDKYTRNFLRHKIIPQFKELQPDLNNKILQLQQQLVEVNEYLEENAKTILEESIVIDSIDKLILDLSKIKHTHISVIRLILLNVFKKITNNKVELSYDKANNIIKNIFNEKPNITFDIGKGFYCIKEYDKLIFRKNLENSDNYIINVTEFGEYTLPNLMKINVENIEEKAKINNNSMIICYNSTMWPLVIRNRQEGDSIKTKIGNKKINRIFIDNKIPVSQRNIWPILTDLSGNILWVIGLQKAATKVDGNKEYILISVE
ncbi:MAG: tilS [Haloplasmataceae bacterium]|jgi:tRNA(Ile)-lysidine synthetase-like protein|nr:tilS [Haloplasmataceae bacterium]